MDAKRIVERMQLTVMNVKKSKFTRFFTFENIYLMSPILQCKRKISCSLLNKQDC